MRVRAGLGEPRPLASVLSTFTKHSALNYAVDIYRLRYNTHHGCCFRENCHSGRSHHVAGILWTGRADWNGRTLNPHLSHRAARHPRLRPHPHPRPGSQASILR